MRTGSGIGVQCFGLRDREGTERHAKTANRPDERFEKIDPSEPLVLQGVDADWARYAVGGTLERT